MKYWTFLWFAGVLSFVSMSEARLGRSGRQYIGGEPKYFYPSRQIQDLAQRVSADLGQKYHVTATMEDSKWQKYATAIKESIASVRFKANEPNLHVDFGDVTKVEVRDGLVVINSLNLTSIQHVSHTVDLSLEIPKVSVTANVIGSCPSTSKKLHCVAVVLIEKLSFDLRVTWPAIKDARISFAEIKKFDVGSVKLTAAAAGDGSSGIVPKSSPVWNQYVSAVKNGLKQSGTDKDLLKDFVKDILF